MPIRMVDDPQDPNEYNDNNDSGGSGSRGGGGFSGGGGLFNLLPLLLGLFRGKGILFLLVIGIGAYFLMGRGGGCSAGSGMFDQLSKLATGGVLDPKQFAKAEVYEGLEDDPGKNPLPEAVSLLRFAPSAQNQGAQGSCVAWSSAYAARTILEAARTGENPDNIAFSPAFLYNQIGLEGCQGSYIIRAMEYMQGKGAVPYDAFPYDENNCTRQPPPSLVQEAAQYRMHGFNRLTAAESTRDISIRSIKEHLATDAPVVIGMMVGQSFMQPMMGQALWEPAPGDESMMGFGGHAMCVVGYDDRKYGGAFLLYNSWGPEWGNNGTAWVRYGDFKRFVREAYGVNTMPATETLQRTPLEVSVGLVKNEDKSYIALRSTGGNGLETTRNIEAGTRFKIEVKNNVSCYIYVFGQETDGSGYILFPYPSEDDPKQSKHTPYCGITGYRLFPKNQSLMADSLGTRDFMAVVVSKAPIDQFAFNEEINKASGDYAAKLNAALRSLNAGNATVSTTSNGVISLRSNASDGAMGCVVQIGKNN